MWRALPVVAFILCLALSHVWAQVSAPIAAPQIGKTANGLSFPPQSSVCSQATTLLGRMGGSENTSAVTTLICGMVTDGTYSLLDGLYVFATNSTGNATLNWAQNAFNITWTSLVNCTFSANNYIQSDGSTCYGETGFIPSSAGGHMTLNSASIGACDLGATEANTAVGSYDGTNVIYMNPDTLVPNVQYAANGGFQTFATTATGSSIVSRNSSSTTINLYQAGVLVNGPTSDSSVALPTAGVAVLALGRPSSTVSNISTGKIPYAFFGAGLTATQVLNIRNRLNTYLGVVGSSSC